MKISVILSVFNVDEILFETITSIYDKDNIELIICISEILKKRDMFILNNYLEKYSNNIIKVEGASLDYCKNKAISISRGDYLYFLNSYENLNIDAIFECYIECRCYYLDILSFNYSILNKYREWSERSSYLGNKISLVSINKYIDTTIMGSMEFYVRLIKNNIYIFNLSNYLIKKFYILKNNIRFDRNMYSHDILFTLNILISNGILKYKPINCLLKHDRLFFEDNELIMNKPLIGTYIKNPKYINVHSIENSINTFKIVIEYLTDFKSNKTCLNYTVKYILYICINIIKLEKSKYTYTTINNFLFNLIKCLNDRSDINNSVKISIDMILYAPNLYNRKYIELIYSFLHNEYNNIIKITNMLDSIKNNHNLYMTYISEIYDIINSNKLFDKFCVVDKIRYIKEQEDFLDISVINKYIRALIDNLYYEIEPDIENYIHMENKFKYILNNL